MKIGMTVRLRSGGPEMTVVKVFDDALKCCWFHADTDAQLLGALQVAAKWHDLRYAEFPKDALLLVRERE